MRLKLRAFPERRALLAAVPKSESLQARMAAFILGDRAWALCREGRRCLAVVLSPRGPRQGGELEELAETFRGVFANELIRRRLQARNRDILEYVVPRALGPRQEPP